MATDGYRLDARKWGFLDRPDEYIEGSPDRFEIEPLRRQFRTAREILSRIDAGRGVLLADDVGLGKTTVAALVAWVVAGSGGTVRIFAPNVVLRRRWAEELSKHPQLLPAGLNASDSSILQGEVGRLHAGRIQVATHHQLVKSHYNGERRTACDLMIIDEAHRAKGENCAFNNALHDLGNFAGAKLILTATPFSIGLDELLQLLHFVGAPELEAVGVYKRELARLHELGDGQDPAEESARLQKAAVGAIEALRPYVIRHGIDDLSKRERLHFGSVGALPWRIEVKRATDDALKLLLRMDRLLGLTRERAGERRNDPRFHIGWEHLATAMERVASERTNETSPVAARHLKAARRELDVERKAPHAKIAAVGKAIAEVVDGGEKVLVFCHHRATARELLEVLEVQLQTDTGATPPPSKKIWMAAWNELLTYEKEDKELAGTFVDWLCTPGLRRQISSWLKKPEQKGSALAAQLGRVRVRGREEERVPTIAEAAQSLLNVLLDPQSGSTRAVLKAIAEDTSAFEGRKSSMPGKLDEGYRVMGAWHVEHVGDAPATLYSKEPDIVLALFNSPFGPDVLVATDRMSEGVDLHRCCRHLVHYELDPSPIRTLQRNGRIRRVGSWAALTEQEIEYAYPSFGGTRDERAVAVMNDRLKAFDLLLGGVPPVDEETVGTNSRPLVGHVLSLAGAALQKANRRLCL